jgi:hypothetical protein
MAAKPRRASAKKGTAKRAGASTTGAKKAGAKRATAAKASATKAPARRAKSIRRADLTRLTTAAVKATVDRPARIVREPIWGFVLDTEAGAIETANVVTQRLAERAGEAGIGLRAEPSVLLRKGVIIAGFIERDLNIPVRF